MLDLLDQFGAKATFFVLGWNAQRVPDLVRRIASRGHEIASHGFYHNLCCNESINSLKEDLTVSKKILEDIIGSQVYGYRAPSFSIAQKILEVIEECGFVYDSNVNSYTSNLFL